MCMDPDQHFLTGIFRPCRIKVLSIHADFPIPIFPQPFITAYLELFGQEHMKHFPVLLEQFPNGNLFLIMEFYVHTPQKDQRLKNTDFYGIFLLLSKKYKSTSFYSSSAISSLISYTDFVIQFCIVLRCPNAKSFATLPE